MSEYNTDKQIAEVADALMRRRIVSGWQPIETAPKDGTEVLLYRSDCGWLLGRYTAPCEFLSEREIEELGEESAQAEDWFYADFISGGRLEGDEAPTHWQPLPEEPIK